MKEYNEFPNEAAQVCAIKNNDLTEDELQTVNYESMSPMYMYDELNSNINSHCLYGKVGCDGDTNTFTHVGEYNDHFDQLSCSYNIDTTFVGSVNNNSDNTILSGNSNNVYVYLLIGSLIVSIFGIHYLRTMDTKNLVQQEDYQLI